MDSHLRVRMLGGVLVAWGVVSTAMAQTERPPGWPARLQVAPAPPPRAPAEAAPSLAWATELPTVAQVREKIRGRDPADTRARQDATFQALRDYIRWRAGILNEDSVPQRSEYAMASGGSKPLDEAAARYYRRGDAFRLEVCSQLLPAPSVAAYKEAIQSTARVQNRGNAFAAEKARATVDLSVFGIPLYEPLRLPQCAPNSEDATLLPGMFGVGRGGPETCVGDATGDLGLLIASMTKKMLGEKEQQAGYTVVTARLAEKACPDWVRTGGTCTAFLTVTPDSYLVGAAVTTGPAVGDLAEKIERQLTKKYKHASVAGEVVTCRNQLTGVVTSRTADRVWDLTGLRAVYTPVNADCQRGTLVVETSVLQRLRGAEKAKAEANEPTL